MKMILVSTKMIMNLENDCAVGRMTVPLSIRCGGVTEWFDKKLMWSILYHKTAVTVAISQSSWTPKGGFGRTALSTIILKRPRIRRKVFLPPKRTRRDTLLFLYHVMSQLRQCCCFFVFPLCNLLPVHIKARCVHILFSPLLGHHVL